SAVVLAPRTGRVAFSSGARPADSRPTVKSYTGHAEAQPPKRGTGQYVIAGAVDGASSTSEADGTLGSSPRPVTTSATDGGRRVRARCRPLPPPSTPATHRP